MRNGGCAARLTATGIALVALLLAESGRGEAGAEKEAKGIASASGVAMIHVPEGWFVMGTNSGREDEAPARKVWVDAFYMDKAPVTQAEYEKVMGENPSKWKLPGSPVDQVRWLDAVKYCNKRSELEGLQPVYHPETWQANFEASGYRLPLEAEWEYAARAGTATKYFFGDDPSRLGVYAWYGKNSGGRTRPVGRKLPNPWGFQDMLGNVWEWCHDHYQRNYYAEAPEKNPRGPASGEMKVLRGGAWDTNADKMTVTSRYSEKPGYADVCVGFDRYGFRPVRRK